ncbi:hypothetical protein AB0N26_32255 [Streptomyces cellulosae]
MLADWYFSSALKLTTHQAKAYLDLMEILRSPHSDSGHLEVALDQLSEQEGAVRVQALPAVLALTDRMAGDEALAQRASLVWFTLLFDGGKQDSEVLDGSAPARELHELLYEALYGKADDFAERVCRVVAQVPVPVSPAADSAGSRWAPTPYHDLHEYVVPAVALALLEHAAAHRPAVVATVCLGDRRLPLVQRAVDGELGRLPLLLAAAILTRADRRASGEEVRARLVEAGRGAADLEPDLLAAAARSWFGYPGEEDGPEPGLLEPEIARGTRHRLWRPGRYEAKQQRDAVKARLGVLDNRPEGGLTAVLWQLTLWELAAAHNPVEAARRTVDWWGPPTKGRLATAEAPGIDPRWASPDDPAGLSWLTFAAKIHGSVPALTAAGTSPGRAPREACSPWAERIDDAFPNDGVRRGRKFYRTSNRPAVLIQIAAVSSLAVALLRDLGALEATDSQDLPDHLLGLLFHAEDVLQDGPLAPFVAELRTGNQRPSAAPVTSSLAALVWHVQQSVERAGTGRHPQLTAETLANFLIEGAGAVESGRGHTYGRQWSLLFRRPALYGVRRWIREAAAGSRQGAGAARSTLGWYGGEQSPAQRVLSEAARRMQDLDALRGTDRRAASDGVFVSALVQEFDGHFTERPDWLGPLKDVFDTGGTPRPVAYEQVLAATPYPLESWQQYGPQIAQAMKNVRGRDAMRTVRLRALLASSDPEYRGGLEELRRAGLEGWVHEWFDTMSGLCMPRDWPRATRAASINFLAPLPDGSHTADPGRQALLRQVFETVIDNIVEFSAAAPRYYELLFDRLRSTDGPLSDENMNRLRIRIIRAIRQHRDAESSLTVLRGPWYVLESQVARAAVEAGLRAFVSAISAVSLAWDDRRLLGEVVDEGWRELTRSPAAVLHLAPAEAQRHWTADARLVTARVVDRFHGRQQSLLLQQDLGSRDAKGYSEAALADVHTMNGAYRAQVLDQWRKERRHRYVTGMVCGFGPEETTGSAERSAPEVPDMVLVNWGADEPLVALKGTTDWRIGDPCRVAVLWDHAEQRWIQEPNSRMSRPARPAPMHGEVRSAEVVSVPGFRPEILVDGIDVSARALDRAPDRWAPDRSVRSAAPAPPDTPRRPLATAARWDEELACWLPADRGAMELIAHDLPYEGPGGCRATVLVATSSQTRSAERPGGHRFVTEPGRSYVLRPVDWVDAPGALDEVLAHGPGTLVYAGLADDGRLFLLNQPPKGAEERWADLAPGSHDTRNPSWQALFTRHGEEYWQAERRPDGSWYAALGEYAVPGFPAEVTVELGGIKGDSCAFRPERWSPDTATVKGWRAEYQVRDHDMPTRGRFEQMWNIHAGCILDVKRCLDANRGNLVRAVTTDGLTVGLNGSTFAFDEWAAVTNMVVTHVKYIPHQPDARSEAPLDDDRFLELIGPEWRELPPPALVSGVVVLMPQIRRTTDFDYGVWLKIGDSLVRAKLPASAFSEPVHHTGATFTAWRRSDDSRWEFRPTHRRIYGSPLYRCTDQDRPPGEPYLLLGRSDGRAYYGRPGSTELVSAPTAAADGKPAGMRGVVLTQVASATWYGEAQYQRLLVRAGKDELMLIGDAPLNLPGSGEVYDVRLRVEKSVRAGLVSLWRELAVRPLKRRARPGAAPAQRPPVEEWRERLAEGVVVPVTGRLRDNVLECRGALIPLVADDGPFVGAVKYSDQARAVLSEHEGELRASTRAARPFTAAEFAAEAAGVTEGMAADRCGLQLDVYYVGRETDDTGRDVRRFEWGCGYTVLLADTELTVGNDPVGDEYAFPLHHGDRLTRMDVRLDAAGRTLINIRPEEDVEIGVGRRTFIEAGLRVLHRLTLRVDPATSRITVQAVRLRRRSQSQDLDQSQNCPIRAELDPVSRDRVLAALARDPRGTAGPLTVEILARFDKDAYLAESPACRFTYLDTGVGPGGIADLEHVFMVAGGIRRDGNETSIEFRLPEDVLREPDTAALVVQIPRRQFSSREHLLPRLFDEGRQDHYRDKGVMLVRLQQDVHDSGRAIGDTTEPPARDGLHSAVAHAGGTLLAAVAGPDSVELRPGVVHRTSQPVTYTRGALVRLQVREGDLRITSAQDADADYIPSHEDRSAVVLPKNSLLTKGVSPGAPGGFTVAGLRGAFGTAEKDYGRRLLETPHPKIALLRRGPGGVRLRPAGTPTDSDPRAATVGLRSPEPQIRVAGATGGTETPAVPWARMSFQDADAEKVRRLCTTPWEYHDTTTSFLLNGRVKQPWKDITRRMMSEEPVFFDEEEGHWTLRYRPEAIRRFGAPATALTEEPRTDRTLYTPITFTVAAPARHPRFGEPRGLWLELSPGRIVEVGTGLLLGPGVYTLDRMDWSLFGPGDRVALEVVRGDVTDPRRLRLTKWEPGPRSALLPGTATAVRTPCRTLLPVTAVDVKRGGLRLGAGDYALTYPAGPATADYTAGDTVVLDHTNQVRPLTGAPPVAPGDTALLGVCGPDDDSLCLLSLADTPVRLSTTSDHWPGSDWLRELLAGPRRIEVLSALGGALPVTVEEVRADGSLVVGRANQPSGALDRTGLLLCQAVAAFDDRLVLRAGAALYPVLLSDVVWGVPAQYREAAARALAAERAPIWLNLVYDRTSKTLVRYTRLRQASQSQPDEFDTHPLALVTADDAPVGLLLRAPHDEGYRWLPAAKLSWAGWLTPEEITEYVVRPGRSGRAPLRVRDLGNAGVSVIDVLQVRQAMGRFALGSVLRVEPLAEVSRAHAVLARSQPHGTFVRLQPSKTHDGHKSGEPLLAEISHLVDRRDQLLVEVVPHGSRAVALDLPQRITLRLAAAAKAHEKLRSDYRAWTDTLDTEAPHPDMAVLQALARLERQPVPDEAELALAALDLGVNLGETGDNRTREALESWLAVRGKAAFHLEGNSELELFPLLAACLTMAELGRDDEELARGAVLLARCTGMRAVRSLHVEHIVHTWLPLASATEDASRSAGAMTTRIKSLQFQAQVPTETLRELLWFGNGVLNRIDDHGTYPRGMAQAVLASAGRIGPGMDLAEGADILAPLAGLGRALAPPADAAVAQPRLLRSQLSQLERAAHKCYLRGSLPLLADPNGPTYKERELAEQILRGTDSA